MATFPPVQDTAWGSKDHPTARRLENERPGEVPCVLFEATQDHGVLDLTPSERTKNHSTTVPQTPLSSVFQSVFYAPLGETVSQVYF